MTEQKLKERAKVIFNSPYASEELNQRNQSEWVKSVQALGKKWLLFTHIKINKKGY